MTKEEKQKELSRIADEIRRCEVCKTGKSGMAVPGEGNADAEVVFVGEAPGKTEAQTAKAFGPLRRRRSEATARVIPAPN